MAQTDKAWWLLPLREDYKGKPAFLSKEKCSIAEGTPNMGNHLTVLVPKWLADRLLPVFTEPEVFSPLHDPTRQRGRAVTVV